MKIQNGYKLATPSHQYMITSVSQMIEDAYYPSGSFSKFQIGRGRTLNDALSKDPDAPTGIKILTGIYYSRPQIAEYVAGYGEGFHDAASELSHAIESERQSSAKLLKLHKAELALGFDTATADLREEYSRRLEEFTNGFVDAYTRDVTQMASQTCGVYFLRKDDEIVYIGQSVNVYNRLYSHRKEKDFDTVEFLPCARDRLDEMEGFFIRLLRPKQNGYNAKTENGAPKSSIWGEVITLPWRQ